MKFGNIWKTTLEIRDEVMTDYKPLFEQENDLQEQRKNLEATRKEHGTALENIQKNKELDNKLDDIDKALKYVEKMKQSIFDEKYTNLRQTLNYGHRSYTEIDVTDELEPILEVLEKKVKLINDKQTVEKLKRRKESYEAQQELMPVLSLTKETEDWKRAQFIRQSSDEGASTDIKRYLINAIEKLDLY